MKLLKTISLCATFLVSASALAVDGYKDLKFGASISDTKKSTLCDKNAWIDSSAAVQKGVSDAWICARFKFGKGSTFGYTFFIDKKLARIAIALEPSMVEAVGKGLTEKYGKPSSMSDLSGEPNTNNDIRWDNNTVILRVSIDGNGKENPVLIYTTSDYDDKLKNIMKKDVAGDL